MTALPRGFKRDLVQPAAEDERGVQPRHFHAGPSPAASSDSDAAATSAGGPSPAARLYRHALESVFAFLSRGELAFALHVSRDWLAAVKSMSGLQLKLVFSSSPVCVVAASAMGRHVTVLGHAHQRLSLNTDALSVVARLMPHLRVLFCALDPSPPGELLSFPAALRELEIDQRGPVSAAALSVTLTAVSRLSRLESFTILLPARLDSHLSFAPLAALPQLRSLDVRWSDDGSLSDAQADELRTMPRLHHLSLSFMTTDTLYRLLRQPHDLQWQQLPLLRPLDDEAAALLPQLPSLTKIGAVVGCERFDWLRGLPNLTEVSLYLRVHDAGRCASLVDGLRGCTNIEILKLVDCPDLTAAQLSDLLPRLPRLQSLSFNYLDIDSLAFLAQPPMTDQLSSLTLWGCSDLPLSELHHLHALRGLKTLHLVASFTEWMDDHSQSLYKPPSLLLPRLEEFCYVEP